MSENNKDSSSVTIKQDKLSGLKHDWLDDGFGNICSKTCPNCHKDTMQIIRPGKFQCYECGTNVMG